MDKYWIWLQNSLKYGSNKVRTVRLIYKNIKDFYHAGEREWRLCGCFTNREIESLKNNTISQSEKIIEKCKKLGYDIVTPDSEYYPKLLREISNPPCVLYVRGDKKCLNSHVSVSIVGTRSATPYGKEMAFDISRDLAKAGVTVISGGAIGIDSEVHKGVICANGKTIAVLGCGINYPYLLKNSDLRRKISEKGAVISEYPPDFPGSAYTFPMRNRIISGMTLGTLVIEAGEKSGSLITANLANEQNRDVFVLPVNKMSSVSGGALKLIRDGAQVVTCANDILNEYSKRQFDSIYEVQKKTDCNVEHFEDLSADKLNENCIISNKKADLENFCEKRNDEYNQQNLFNDKIQDCPRLSSEIISQRENFEQELYSESFNKENSNEIYIKRNAWKTYFDKINNEPKKIINETKKNSHKIINPQRKTHKNEEKTEKFEQDLSNDSKKIFNLLKKGDMHIDDISKETGILIKNLLAKLTELELLGLIKACSGGIYKINI